MHFAVAIPLASFQAFSTRSKCVLKNRFRFWYLGSDSLSLAFPTVSLALKATSTASFSLSLYVSIVRTVMPANAYWTVTMRRFLPVQDLDDDWTVKKKSSRPIRKVWFHFFLLQPLLKRELQICSTLSSTGEDCRQASPNSLTCRLLAASGSPQHFESYENCQNTLCDPRVGFGIRCLAISGGAANSPDSVGLQ